MKKPTIIIGENGTEYVVRGGRISEKCQHNVSRDESNGKVRKVVCNDCGKILMYNDRNPFEEGTINGFSL